jgi:hypothetical protein
MRTNDFGELQSRTESREKKVKTMMMKANQVDFLTLDSVKFAGGDYTIDAQVSQWFTRVLRIPGGFSRNLARRDIEIWRTLVNGLKSRVEDFCTVQVDNESKRILSIQEAGSRVLPNSEFIKVFTKKGFLEEAKLKLDTALYEDDRVDLIFMFDEQYDLGKNSDGSRDLYQLGVHVFNDAKGRDQITALPANRRLVCSNGMTTPVVGSIQYRKDFVLDAKAIPEGQLKQYVRSLTLRMCQEALKMGVGERVQQSRETFASYEEAYDAYRFLERHEDSSGECRIEDLPEKLNLSYVDRKYGINSARDVSHNWRMRARTPFKMNYLQNLLTWEASHNVKLTERESLQMRVEAGRILYKEFDLPHTKDQIKFERTWEDVEFEEKD